MVGLDEIVNKLLRSIGPHAFSRGRNGLRSMTRIGVLRITSMSGQDHGRSLGKLSLSLRIQATLPRREHELDM